MYSYSPRDRIPSTSAAYPAAFPVGLLPTNANDTGLVVKTTSLSAWRADGTPVTKAQLGDPGAFTGNGYMLLGLEADAVAARYRDDSAERGGPMMLLASPTLPGRGLNPACSVYGSSVLILPDASLDAVHVNASLCTQGEINEALLYATVAIDGTHAGGLDAAMSEPGPTEWGDTGRRRRALGRASSPTTRGMTRSCCATATLATSSTPTGTGPGRRSSPTSTGADTRCTWRSRTSATTPTSARWCAPPTPSPSHTVHIVGRRRWNRRGAMVTDRYQRLCHHDSTAELLDFAADAGLDRGRGRQRARVRRGWRRRRCRASACWCSARKVPASPTTPGRARR